MQTKVFSIVFILFGIFCGLLFLPPYLKSIINAGNIAGMGISILLILYGCFFSRMNHAIAALWQYRNGKILLSIASLICVVGLVLVIIITSCIVKAATNEPPKNTTAIVLGCAVHGTRPSLMLERRLEAALAYLEENPEASAILSGGQGPGEDITEAQCMFEYLTRHGISENRLYLEGVSENTEENIRYSKEILKTLQQETEIAIITNEFHQYRASILAKDAGLVPYSVNGKSVSYLLPTYYVRELMAVLKQWIFS